MSARNILLAAEGSADDKLYVDDVFSAYTRTGTGADATVTTGIDMTKGYMLWSKARSGITDHAIYDSVRGVTYDLASNLTAAQTTKATGLKAVSTVSHTVGSLAKMNTNAASYVDFVFRKAPKFFDVQTIGHTNGTATNISLTELGNVGLVIAKITNTTGNWITWHRSIASGNNLLLNTKDEQTTTNAWLSVSGTTATLSSSAPTGSYVVYSFAHDPSADGIIQCGSYTGNGSATGPIVNLEWEPQFVLVKRSSSGTGNWQMQDIMRGMSGSVFDVSLAANSTGSEDNFSSFARLTPETTGFQIVNSGADYNANSIAYIYLAIRRPNKPPTSGTEVYNAIARTGTGATPVDVNAGLSPDLVSIYTRDGGQDVTWVTKLNAKENQLFTSAGAAEVGSYSGITQFLPTGVTLYDAPGVADMNQLGFSYINHFFRRAPGFFDVVCDVGTGAAHTVAHNLTVAPEFVIRKSRSAATQWEVWHSALAATEKLVLSSAAAKATDATAWNSALPGASSFTVGAGTNVNASGEKFVAYLFASLPGISKCGNYPGNGTSQTINCGFTTGARFILIKRTDAAGDWYVWDSARGIVSANDPHLSLNSYAADVTTDDSVDPDASGFIVNQVAATNVNVTGATYLYLAIA